MSLRHTLQLITSHPLNRDRKVAAVLDFVRWQCASRLHRGEVVHNWVGGSRFLIRRGETGLSGNIYCGLQEFQDMAYLLHSTSPADLFVDIGANVGSYTLLACAARGARGICFEPVPLTFKRLQDNLRLNNLETRATAMNIGLADKPGELMFTTGENCMNHAVAPGESTEHVTKVEVRTLDEVLAGQAPSVIKMDVEGFETLVIRGARATLENPALHSVIMELNGSGARYGFDEAAILATMKQYGFETFRYAPFTREITLVEVGHLHDENTLFIRDVETARKRVKASPEFVAHGRRI